MDVSTNSPAVAAARHGREAHEEESGDAESDRGGAVRRHPRQAGVERLYGVVGDSLNPVVDAIRRNAAIDWIQVRHEEAAAFAAGAEAQITGRLAACAGSCGPGNLHLINGLYDAHRSMAPVLALASHIPSSEIGLGYFQETHPDQLFRECSHYCEMISNPQQMPRLLQTAIQHAIGRGGVSVVVAARRHRVAAPPPRSRSSTPWSPPGPPSGPATPRSTSWPR